MKLNKNKIVEIVSEETGKTRKEAKEIIDKFLEVVYDQVSRGNVVSIGKFGRFYGKEFIRDKVFVPLEGKFVGPCKRVIFKFKPSPSTKVIREL